MNATREQLAEYLRTHPDTPPIEAVAHVGADPARWIDPVADALDAPEPHVALSTPTENTGAGESEKSPDYAGTDPDPEDETPTLEAGGSGSRAPMFDDWSDADFSTTKSDTYPPTLLDRESWMGRLVGEKMPFAPWGDRDHAEADADKDARYKWGIKANYVGGDTVAIAEDDPRLGGRVFIQRESDPFAFVDGDDVRDPETGDVHPAFTAILELLGATYADVSTSGAGVHAYYLAPEGLPINGKGQATFEIDTEPWGANDDPPTVEIYANKHVNVTTGEHVLGTPDDLAEWDPDPLRAILQANGYDDKDPVAHDTHHDRIDLDEYDPDATDATDAAEDMRDVYVAVDRLTPRDLPLSTRRTGEDSTGWTTWDPAYRSSSSGESLHYNGEGAFHDHKEGEAFGVLSLFAAEQGIIREPWDRLAGSDWFGAVDAARDAGAPIPDPPDTGAGIEHTTVLPPSVRDLSTATSGWDWRHTAEHSDDTLTIDDARERTTNAIADAYSSSDRVLIEALPTMGKSYGAIKAAAETDEPISVLTGRGHKEQYGQFKDWADEHGLSYKQLPSFTHDCDTANGEHGEEWADTVQAWYNRDATPKAIHKFAENVLGRPLPCQERKGERCPYASKWDFDPDEYDVLIGHYAHAHREDKVVNGRAVVFDEFPGGAYETDLGPRLQGAVSYWLKCTDAVPFEDYTDLIENRDDEQRRADALLWFDEQDLSADETHVFDDASAHAAAPLAVFTLLAGEGLGNGFEHADLEGGGRGVFNRASGAVSLLRPPDLQYASGVIALDGTPTKRMWELALGEQLNHRPVLQNEERAEYIRDALNLNLVRTTEHVKPYNSSDHVNTKQDAALLEAIRDEHDDRPSVITTATAEHEYDAEGVLQYVGETKHYGNILGSNEFDDTRLGAVIGSNHYGDGHIKKWGAYAGEAVERGEEKGAELSYTGFGDDVLQHMREHDTLQAAMRFGRDGNGAVVYVHTETLPDWVPVAGEGRVIRTKSDGERRVVKAVEELGSATTATLAEHADLSHRQTFDHLERLREEGYLAREQDSDDGRVVRWVNDELHRTNEHGEVQLDTVDIDDLDTAEVAEVARSSTYTWDLRNSTPDPAGEGRATPVEEGTTEVRARTDGGRPPDPPE